MEILTAIGALPFIVAGVGAVAVYLFLLIVSWRRVVPTNIVHVVQTRKKTTSYGAGMTDGNVYYEVPSWVPVYGCTVIKLPVSNFDQQLDSYRAYDRDRAEFDVDVVAFFRIADTNRAAERVSSFAELQEQLLNVVRGAVRKIMAQSDIHTIMTERATFGEQFTNEVRTELESWGVEPVKSLELMDIRDNRESGSHVIRDIMAMKAAEISRNSRVKVADENRAAQVAEIEAAQVIEVRAQEAKQLVGQREAEQLREVGIAKQQAEQAIQREAEVTKQREMAVLSVDTQRRAEITKDAGITAAEEQKQREILAAEARLVSAERDAEAVKVRGDADGHAKLAVGSAEAEAAKMMKLADVDPQIKLASEIGENEGYQNYLLGTEQIRQWGAIGIAQSEALVAAKITVVANGGTAAEGVSNIGDLLSSSGGFKLGAALEGFSATPVGKVVTEAMKNGNGGTA